jgi:hypothetical protein
MTVKMARKGRAESIDLLPVKFQYPLEFQYNGFQ